MRPGSHPDARPALGIFFPHHGNAGPRQQSGLRRSIHAAGRHGRDARISWFTATATTSPPASASPTIRSAGTSWSCAAASASTTSACRTFCSPTRAATRPSSRASASAAETPGTPFANDQILYALGSGNSIYSYPVNPALAIGIDPATGAVLNRTVEVWGAQQNFPTALRLRLLVEFRLQPARPHGGLRGIPGQHGPSPAAHRQSEFPLPEQSGLRSGLLPAAGRQLQLQCAQPEP